jgi:hypothetical protein
MVSYCVIHVLWNFVFQAVLNFMYHGEVNLAQEDLNSFLQVAEDLRVKGRQTHSFTYFYSSNSKT